MIGIGIGIGILVVLLCILLEIKKSLKIINAYLASIDAKVKIFAGDEFTIDFILSRAAEITGQEILTYPNGRKILGERNPQFE